MTCQTVSYCLGQSSAEKQDQEVLHFEEVAQAMVGSDSEICRAGRPGTECLLLEGALGAGSQGTELMG